MSAVIVTADIVGSTAVKARYDQATAVRKIRAALESVREDLCKVDEHLHCPAPYAGDSILLVGGMDAVEIYHAAVVHQAVFRAWWHGRMPIRLTLGYGVYETVSEQEQTSFHGADLDMLYRVCAWCPPGGVMVTQSMFSLLEDAGFGSRFHERRESLKGFGQTVFYQSNGDFTAPRQRRWPRWLKVAK